jgi:hypothetical protein
VSLRALCAVSGGKCWKSGKGKKGIGSEAIADFGLRRGKRNRAQGTREVVEGVQIVAPECIKKVDIGYNIYILLIPKWNLNSINAKAI